MIVFDDVTKIYKKSNIPAVKNVSFNIKKGEFVFITGPSGAGKSTIVKLITREILAEGGFIKINGIDIKKIPKRKVPYLRRNIGMVFQDFRLISTKNVFDNVAFAMRIVGKDGKTITQKVNEILNKLGILKKARASPSELSGGEQQKVSIARAIVNSPSILIADEPTGNLDQNSGFEIMEIFNQINQTGTTILVVTHAREIVDFMKKRIINFNNGKITKEQKGFL